MTTRTATTHRATTSRKGRIGRRTLLHLLLIGGSLLMLVPFLWAVSASLKPPSEVFDSAVGFIPDAPTTSAYQSIFQQISFGTYFMNSVIVTLAVVALNIIFDTAAAYGFAKLRFPGRDLLFAILLLTLMVPPIINIIPLYRIMVSINQVVPWLGVDTLSGIVMPSMVQVFGIFLLRQFFTTIPDSIIEAARLDGASELTILWRVVLPLVSPAVATLVIFLFLETWNDFLWPLLISNSDSSKTLPVGLTLLSRKNTVDWPQTMAGSVVTIVPMVLVFIALQRRFIEGIAAGAVK